MTEVYLCDDEPVWTERMEQAVSDFIVNSDWELKVVCRAALPHELLDCLSQHDTLGGIYFLDIDLQSEINGLELGARIRESDPEAVLIFVTTHDELVMDTFRLKLQAMDYIIKDSGSLRSQIADTLCTVESRYHHSAGRLTAPRIRLDTGSSCHFVRKDDIYFVESEKNMHKLFVHLRSEVFTISMSLKDIAEQLGDRFILCRRGCLVNPLHVDRMDRSTREIILDNEERCRCSYREWSVLTERISDRKASISMYSNNN